MIGKRMLGVTVSVAAGLIAALIPSAQATVAATQENVRHVKNVPGATGGHSVVEGNRLYVGAYGLGMRIFDITDPTNPVPVGQYTPGPSGLGDIGVRADAVPDAAIWNGRHIATLNGTRRVSGQTDRTEFLDVTNPAAPVLLHTFLGQADGEAHNGDLVDARKLWLPSGGVQAQGFRIYDVSPVLATPPGAPVNLFRADPVTMWLNSPYRINTGKPVGTLSASGHHTHDIEVYTDRQVLLPPWEWPTDPETGEPVPTYALKDIALVAWSTGYVVDGAGANTHSVFVIDITNPRNPVVINRWQNTADGDRIRYLHEVQFLNGDPSTMIATDEDLHSGCQGGRLYTIRVSEDLMTATKLAEWAIGSAQADTPTCMGSHVFSSHNRYVFMGAYTSGLQVLDLSDPGNPRRAGRYIAEGMNSWGALYNKGYIYVGDFGARGLDVFQFIANPVASAILKAPNPTSRTQFSVSEQGCVTLNDPHGPTDQVDALMVTIPENIRTAVAGGEDHIIRGVGAGDAATDVDIWFYDENCAYMPGTGVATDSGAVETAKIGAISNGEGEPRTVAKYASIVLYTGNPGTRAYAQIDPPF